MRRLSLLNQVLCALVPIAVGLGLLGGLTCIGQAASPLSQEVATFPPFGTPDSIPSSFTRVGDSIFFAADDGAAGYELWHSDGTEEGTRLVKDLWPGRPSSGPHYLVALENLLVFAAYSPDGTNRLWRSDGTAEGTFVISGGEILPSPAADQQPVAINGMIYFRAVTPETGPELWSTDGTSEGTRLVIDLKPGAEGSYPSNLSRLSNHLVFSAYDDNFFPALYVTDGTVGGTRRLTDRAPTALYPAAFPQVGGVALFKTTTDESGEELWRTDGTPEGTFLLKDIYPGPTTSEARIGEMAGDQLFFSARDKTHGAEIWVTDGTEAGTRLYADIRPGPDSSSSRPAFVRDGRLFLWVFDELNDFALWSSDGTPEGTAPFGAVKSGGGSNATSGESIRAGKWTIFRGGGGPENLTLWATDGTVENTRPLIESAGDIYSSSEMTSLGSSALLRFTGSLHGSEPWITNGTLEGTQLLRDVNRYHESWMPTQPVAQNNRLIFAAQSPNHGRELFASDGTAAGTQMLIDANPGPRSSRPTHLMNVGTSTLFLGQTGFANQSLGSLFASDGTPLGTIPVKTSVDLGWRGGTTALASDGERVIFASPPTDFRISIEPWILDSPSSVPRLIRRLASDDTFTGSLPSDFVAVGDKFIFTAASQFADTEVYVTDGTADGTRLIKDLWPGRKGSRPRLLRSDGTLAYFFALNLTESGLFRSDGTPEGTFHLASAARLGPIEPMTVPGGRGCFFPGIDAATGTELWVTDGTVAGTRRVRDITPGPGSTDFVLMKAVNGLLYFSCTAPDHGTEVWRSDGTESGTILLADIAPGDASSRPANFFGHLGHCFFSAWDPEHGRELWSSDGTVEGTVLVEDGVPGSGWSQPIGLASMGDELYYFATSDELPQAQLRLLPAGLLSVTTPNPSQGSVDGGGRFTVGTSARLTATARPGFIFSHWEALGVADPRSENTQIRLTTQTTATAIFQSVPSLTQWLESFGLSGDALLPQTNPQGDGWSNLLKYAFNLDPTLPFPTPASVEEEGGAPTLSNDGSGRVRISYHRRRNAPISYQFQHSADLQTWLNVEVGPELTERLSSEWERVTREFLIGELPSSSGALRVKVDSPAP